MTIAAIEAPTSEPTAPRRMPWAGLVSTNMVGNVEAEEGLTSEQMLEASNLNWDVDIRPLWRRMNDGSFEQHPKQREVYRVDNEDPLGICRTRYETFSNREAFAFGDALVEQGKGKWVVAGQQAGGARVFMVMKLGEGFEVLGGDSYQNYLYLRTSHGDGTSVSASVIPFRLWCLNQNGLATRQALSNWSVPHTTTVKDRLAEARNTLKLSVDYEAEFKKIADQLASVKVTDEQAKKLIDSVVHPRRARRDDVVTDILENYQHSETVEPFRGTGYGLFNALTEYMDHIQRRRSDNARFESIMHSEGANTRNNLLRNLQALA